VAAFKIPSLCQGGDRSWTNWVSLVYVSGSTVGQLLIGVIRARKQWCWCQLHTQEHVDVLTESGRGHPAY